MKPKREDKLIDILEEFTDFCIEIDSVCGNEFKLWIPDYIKLLKEKENEAK